MNRLLKIFISLIVIISNISCDQITKEKARVEIEKNEIIEVINDNFILTKVENTGAAMSLGQNLPPKLKIIILQILPLLTLILMFFHTIRKKESTKLNLIAFSFIIGGGIGNIYDRILYNSVTDFMYIKLGTFHTGIFNMADVSVVVGALLLFLNYAKLEMDKKRFSY
ncbi:signal peptidase II [Tenacibaculum sp. E3R01]|uniref:signal peptidase II n=1 Tax=Tenacibaculum sp. E3R01 TaxID=2267227 RepID=UPI000DEA1BAE|nr:signal peptidase II [Tenacibaculum sp. E3R01]RBW62318.1 signal peptidase II [Tenacibaculum sp. E3R01]